MRLPSSLCIGIVFGMGLSISGMTNPAKVLNFLDLFGTWDPSLAFVMMGAIAVTLPGYAWLRQQGLTSPLFANDFSWPTLTEIDQPLLRGAALFGVGWGLGGFCPGPAVASAASFNAGTVGFLVTLLLGLWLAKLRSALT